MNHLFTLVITGVAMFSNGDGQTHNTQLVVASFRSLEECQVGGSQLKAAIQASFTQSISIKSIRCR